MDGDGDLTSTTYDADGNVLTQVMTHDGTTISYLSQAYDAAGNVTYALDGAGNATSSIYDGGNLVSQVVKNGSTILSDYTYSYDDAGNVTGTTDVYGNVTDDTYVGNQLTSELVTDASGHTISYESNAYDNAGNVIETIDGDDDITLNYYNGNELTETIAGYGTTAAATTLYSYDENGNQTSEVDPDNNTTLYTYDANGDVLTTANASGTTTYAYNELGQMTSAIDANNRTISYSYDGTNLTTETWYNSSGTQTEQMTWTYDEDGNILTAGNNAGSYTMTYIGNQMATQIDPSGLTLSYTYDDAGDLTKTVDSQGGTTMYSYEDGLVTMKTFSNGTSQMGVVFGYDEEGNLTSETRYANTALTTLAGSTTNTYDDNVLTAIVDKDASGNVLQSFGYTYDDAGQLTTQVADGVTTTYQYDATGEMTAAGTQTYSYDANGNPDEAGNTVSSDNEVTVNNGNTQAYDAVGNLTQAVTSSGDTWSYSYDNANELVSAVETYSGSTLVSETFQYDVFGNRISESLTQSGTTTTTNMVYDTNSGTLYADESSGTITTWYVSNVNGTNQWLARVDSTGTNWLLSDYQGSVTGVVSQSTGAYTLITFDAYGNTTNVAYYTSSGTVTTSSYAPAEGRLDFQGMQFEAQIGLYISGVRWYNPEMEQWLEVDPTPMLGAGPNPYEAMGDMPTNATDPTGRDIWIEGNGPGEPTFHRSIAIGDPNGDYVQFSFAAYGAGLTATVGRGFIYVDKVKGGAIVPGTYYRTDSAFDKKIIDILNQHVGDKDLPYDHKNNCRTFSEVCHASIVTRLKTEKPDAAPAPEPSRPTVYPSAKEGGGVAILAFISSTSNLGWKDVFITTCTASVSSTCEFADINWGITTESGAPSQEKPAPYPTPAPAEAPTPRLKELTREKDPNDGVKRYYEERGIIVR